jgi:hypothetical protein
MPISRGQMPRELYGVGSLVGREKFGLGSKLKKFVRKIIPNEVAEVAVKAAPFVAPFNPLLAGGMSALGTFDQTGRIGQSVKSGLINYGLGQGARYLGGAGFQQGVNPFAGGSYGFSSPLGTETGIGKLLADKGYIGQTTGPQTFDQKYSSIEDVLFETAPDKLSTAQKAGIVFDKNIAQTATPGFKESVSKLFSGDFTTMGEGLKELGGKALKTIYTNKDGSIDKLAIGATIAGGANYIEAKQLAEEAGLVDDADEYTEEMYEADKQAYLDKYSSILTPAAFGLKDGGRVKYAGGGLSKNRIAQLMSLLESGEIDEDYKKQIKEEIDQLMGKYKSGGRVKFLKGGDTEYNAMVTEMYIKAGGKEGTGMDIDTFAEKYFSKFAKGGRANLQIGGIPSIKLEEQDDEFMSFDELKEKYPGMAMDTTTYNPIPENAPEMAAAEIAKVIMGTRGMPEEGLTDVMSSTEFIFDSYVIPKRKELMENFGLSLPEADELIKKEMAKYKTKKAKGGRIGYAFGTDRDGIMSLEEELDQSTIYKPEDDEPKDKLEMIDDMMAYFPGDVFSKSQITALFKDKSLTTNQDRKNLYKLLMNPGMFPEAEKELLKMLKSKGYEKGGRVQYAMGSEVPVRKNAGGITELDYRNTGGFVPIGVKEKADDVPAMLSKNEFVFTADAVRAAGGGSVNKGAQKMYNLMKSLENKVV